MLGELLGSPTRRRLLKSLVGVGSIPIAGGILSEHTKDETGQQAGVSPSNVIPNEPTKTINRVAKPKKVNSSSPKYQKNWLYGGELPGPEIRVTEGTALAVQIKNKLSQGTTVHWHGLPVPNQMDGVPDVTQDLIPPEGAMTYEFAAAPAGTYLYHSHAGLQMDRGLVGPLIVESADPNTDYDRDYTVFLDDYLSRKPPSYADDPHVPNYDAFLVNGKFPTDPATFGVREGERVKFRIVNGGSATTFRVGLAGHIVEVTHADGHAVEGTQASSIEVGPGERIDVFTEMKNPGRWFLEATPTNASSVGNPGPARAIVEYQSGSNDESLEPEFTGEPVTWRDLTMASPIDGVSGRPDQTFELTLSRGFESRSWVIEGEKYPDADPLTVRPGDHVRFRLVNRSDVAHPMHLHGHFFTVGDAIKDTVLVRPHETVDLDFRADNPGSWLFHCHNEYHRESGMARIVKYET